MIFEKITVNDVHAIKTLNKRIPAGTIGAQVQFEFGPMWGDLIKTAVFRGCCTKDVLNIGDTVTIPAEVIAKPCNLQIGIYGVDGNGNATPTFWSSRIIVGDATDPSGDTTTDPSLPVWAQLQADVERLKQQGGGGSNGTVDEATVQKIVDDYLAENPPVSGEDGEDGITPHIGDNGNWYLGDLDTGIKAQGETGPQGPAGPQGEKGADGKSAYAYAQDGGYTGTEEEFAEKLAADPFDSERLSRIETAIADLQYKKIEITSIINDVGTVELGSTVDTVKISWALNKEPVSQTLNGETVEAASRSVTLEGLGLTANKAFTLEVTDERDATDSGTTRIYFYNGVYYGVLEDGAVLDSAAIMGLTRKLQSTKTLTFAANAGSTQRIAFALPAQGYGTPNFNVGGFDGGFTKVATIDFTNASGHMERYDVWLSDNTGLGSTTVNVT